VLFALLIFSGVGSRLSGRVPETELRRTLPRMLLGVAALVALCVPLLSPLLHALVHLELPLRIAVTVVVLAPLGLAMGMPMPTAIRILAGDAPAIIPWGWGVNGAASVMGSVGALTIALFAGFNVALLAAAALYVVAFALVRRA
jgi:hypothetical protein